MKMSVLYNLDTRTSHDILGGIRIFGSTKGHKSKKRDTFCPELPPARINTAIEPSHVQITINTDRSAVCNGWENATAGIGVWYANGSRRNIALKLENQQNHPAFNSRAELSAILEALRRNEEDDLVIDRVRLIIQPKSNMHRLGQIRRSGMVWNTERRPTKRYPD